MGITHFINLGTIYSRLTRWDTNIFTTFYMLTEISKRFRLSTTEQQILFTCSSVLVDIFAIRYKKKAPHSSLNICSRGLIWPSCTARNHAWSDDDVDPGYPSFIFSNLYATKTTRNTPNVWRSAASVAVMFVNLRWKYVSLLEHIFSFYSFLPLFKVPFRS